MIYKLISIFLIIYVSVVPVQAQDILNIAFEGDLVKVKELIEKDHNLINTKNENLKTAMHYAAQGGHLEIVKYLQSKGSDILIRNIADETPLHYAAAGGHENVIKYLLEQGVDIDIQNVNGVTPLLYGIFLNKDNAVELLIKMGCNISLKDVDGNTPLDIALEGGDKKIIDILEAADAPFTPIPDPDIKKISGKIHRLSFKYNNEPNMCFSAGKDGVLLIDTGFRRYVEKLNKTIDDLNTGGLKFVINTHLHPDHVGGNNIAGDQTPVISLNTIEQSLTNGLIKTGSGKLTGRNGLEFESYYTMDFNGEEIRLLPSQGVHTATDMIIHFTGSNVIHMGDLLLPESFPAINGTVVEAYYDILDKTIDVFPENAKFICGHGKDCTINDIKEYKKMLVASAEIVKTAMKAGKSIEEMVEANILKEYDSYNIRIPQLNTDYWIAVVYQFYKDKL